MTSVNYMNFKKKVHRDIKPENIVIINGDINNIKLKGFLAAEDLPEGQRLYERIGTHYYIAPEVIKKDYGSKCDVWSCGVIAYLVLSGRLPFNSTDEQEVMN